MATETKKPAGGQSPAGRKQRYFYNRPFQHNTRPPEISTETAKRIFHDIHLVMQKEPGSFAHFRWSAP